MLLIMKLRGFNPPLALLNPPMRHAFEKFCQWKDKRIAKGVCINRSVAIASYDLASAAATSNTSFITEFCRST